MKKHYQIAIDQSTSGTKVLLFKEGKLVDRLDKSIDSCIQRKAGWNIIPSKFVKMSVH